MGLEGDGYVNIAPSFNTAYTEKDRVEYWVSIIFITHIMREHNIISVTFSCKQVGFGIRNGIRTCQRNIYGSIIVISITITAYKIMRVILYFASQLKANKIAGRKISTI